jgi:hypothetical protein
MAIMLRTVSTTYRPPSTEGRAWGPSAGRSRELSGSTRAAGVHATGDPAATEVEMTPIEVQLVELQSRLAEAEQRAVVAEAMVDMLREQAAREIGRNDRLSRERRRTWWKRLLLG